MNISDIDSIRKRQFAYYCVALALPIALGFLVYDIFNGAFLEAMLNSLLFLGLLAGYIGIRKFNVDMLTYRATLALVGIIFLYNTYIGSGDGAVLYWILPLPLIFLFFLEKFEGGLFSGILFCLMCVLLFNPFSLESYVYDAGVRMRFLFSQVLVILMAYGLEAAREKFGNLLIEKQERLLEEKKQLEEAMKEIRTLSGLIPICSNCKKIRDDKGYWQQVDVYVSQHSTADFSHGICPDCLGDYYKKIEGISIK
jgi:hypothetical protein